MARDGCSPSLRGRRDCDFRLRQSRWTGQGCPSRSDGLQRKPLACIDIKTRAEPRHRKVAMQAHAPQLGVDQALRACSQCAWPAKIYRLVVSSVSYKVNPKAQGASTMRVAAGAVRLHRFTADACCWPAACGPASGRDCVRTGHRSSILKPVSLQVRRGPATQSVPRARAANVWPPARCAGPHRRRRA